LGELKIENLGQGFFQKCKIKMVLFRRSLCVPLACMFYGEVKFRKRGDAPCPFGYFYFAELLEFAEAAAQQGINKQHWALGQMMSQKALSIILPYGQWQTWKTTLLPDLQGKLSI
jgi:hypothetical protein